MFWVFSFRFYIYFCYASEEMVNENHMQQYDHSFEDIYLREMAVLFQSFFLNLNTEQKVFFFVKLFIDLSIILTTTSVRNITSRMYGV